MPIERPNVVIRNDSLLLTHSVLRNTYLLLSVTLLFSGLTSWFALSTNALPMNPFLSMIILFGLLFLIRATSNSIMGIASVFLFTGFFGWIIGPILNMYIHGFTNGSELVLTAVGGTAVIFLSLSAFVIVSRRDFSFMGGMLFVALIAGIVLSIAGLFFAMPMLNLILSGLFILVFSGYILFDTSRIIHGGETNYINATVALYLDIVNLFLNLLSLLSILGGRRD